MTILLTPFMLFTAKLPPSTTVKVTAAFFPQYGALWS